MHFEIVAKEFYHVIEWCDLALFLSIHILSTIPSEKVSKKNVVDLKRKLAEAKKIMDMNTYMGYYFLT